MNEDETCTKTLEVNHYSASEEMEEVEFSWELNDVPQSDNQNTTHFKPLSLPWPRKNTHALKKANSASVTLCWTFLDTLEDDCKLDFDCEVQLKVRSLRRLMPGMMVNDEVMNASFRYLEEKLSRQKRKIKFFSSFFFTTLHGNQDYDPSNYNFNATKRWTKPARLPGMCQNVFELEMLVFPIFLKHRSHWICGVILNKDRYNSELFLLNSDDFNGKSYRAEHIKIMNSMNRWWKDEHMARVGGLCPSLRATVVSNIPQQKIGSNDCGPFSYAYASLFCFLSTTVPQWPNFLDGPLLRDMILYNLLRKSERFRNFKKALKS